MATESANGTVAGAATIDVGAGEEQWVYVQAAVGRVLTFGRSLQVLTDNPVGWNWVSLTGVDVRSWTDIWTGDGMEDVRITGSTFRGEFALDTDGGDDFVWIEWAGGSTSFRGPASGGRVRRGSAPRRRAGPASGGRRGRAARGRRWWQA